MRAEYCRSNYLYFQIPNSQTQSLFLLWKTHLLISPKFIFNILKLIWVTEFLSYSQLQIHDSRKQVVNSSPPVLNSSPQSSHFPFFSLSDKTGELEGTTYSWWRRIGIRGSNEEKDHEFSEYI